MTYAEVKNNDLMTLKEKAQWLLDEQRDYMNQGNQILIVEGPDEVWLCESTSGNLDECEKVSRII